MAAWALKPDTLDDAAPATTHLGVFGITVVAFFLAASVAVPAGRGLVGDIDAEGAVDAGARGSGDAANAAAIGGCVSRSAAM